MNVMMSLSAAIVLAAGISLAVSDEPASTLPAAPPTL